MQKWASAISWKPNGETESERRFLDYTDRSWSYRHQPMHPNYPHEDYPLWEVGLWTVTLAAGATGLSRRSARRMLGRMEVRGWLRRWP